MRLHLAGLICVVLQVSQWGGCTLYCSKVVENVQFFFLKKNDNDIGGPSFCKTGSVADDRLPSCDITKESGSG